MPPLHALDTWSERTETAPIAPRGHCFLIAEGANTELWYLSELATRYSKKNLPRNIELVPIKREGDEANDSNPRKLLEQAERIKDGKTDISYNQKLDRFLFIFDLDIYKDDVRRYREDLFAFKAYGDESIAVTNPSFELYLLLHKDGTYERIVKPQHEEILANKYADHSRQRLIAKLANEELGANLKKNKRAVEELVAQFETACRQETNLNQDPEVAISKLTSNVGAALSSVING